MPLEFAPGSRTAPRGFTLLELLVALAIAAVLTTIALPNYQNQVMRARRTTATAALQHAAQYLERNMTANHCYNFTSPNDCAAQKGTALELPASLSHAPAEGTAFYDLGFAKLGEANYTLHAKPIGSGPQYRDPCGTLLLAHTGRKGEQGTWTPSAPKSCWGG
jgi:type IV pilus assembly protein PilE